jgi:hypothetical protein
MPYIPILVNECHMVLEYKIAYTSVRISQDFSTYKSHSIERYNSQNIICHFLKCENLPNFP